MRPTWHTSSTPDATASQVERLVDEAMDAYLQWRVECIALAEAHDRWAAVRGGDPALAQACADALDREQDAADEYARLCRKLGAPSIARAQRACG